MGEITHKRKSQSTRSRKLTRYRIVKLIIPLSLIIYVAMLYLHYNSLVASDKLEIYPFAGWRLFSYTPERFGIEFAVVLDSLNEQPVNSSSDARYLIPNDTYTSIDDQSVLKRTVDACAANPDCDEAEVLLFPVVERLMAERGEENTENIEFSIIRVKIDYSDVLEHIRELADGIVKKTDFYEPEHTIGRWSTLSGRIMSTSSTQDDTIEQDGSDSSTQINSVVTPIQDNDAVLVSQSYFTIYLDGQRNIIYARPACTQTDLNAKFFLHIIPYYLNDLSEHRKQTGFDNLDFNFQDDHARENEEGDCITVQQLPEYRISSIRTGQFTDTEGQIWETQFEMPDSLRDN